MFSSLQSFHRVSFDVLSPASLKRVLYVEDHPINAMLMRALLETHSRVLLTVEATGEAGLRSALRDKPDLLLLDLNLPDCHGMQLLERMRVHPQLAQVPAVAVTAEDSPNLTGTTFSEVWFKPLDLKRTLARMDSLLGLAVPMAAAPAVAGKGEFFTHAGPVVAAV